MDTAPPLTLPLPRLASVQDGEAFAAACAAARREGATSLTWRGVHYALPRNDAYPEATQLVWTACDWRQTLDAAAPALLPRGGDDARVNASPASPRPDSDQPAPAAAQEATREGTRTPRKVDTAEGDGIPGEAWALLLRRIRARLACSLHAMARAVGHAGAAAVSDAVLNTLRYLFFHQRCGILVAFRGGRLATFLPFVNAGTAPSVPGEPFRNTWGAGLWLEGEAPPCDPRATESRATDSRAPGPRTTDPRACQAYLERKAAALGRPAASLDYGGAYLRNRAAWWANAGILCNIPVREHWGDAYLGALHDMLQAAARHAREVQGAPLPDATFFINKRDAGQLRCTLEEPADFCLPPPSASAHAGMHGGGGPGVRRAGAAATSAIPRERYSKYAPIFSFFVDERLPPPAVRSGGGEEDRGDQDGGGEGTAGGTLPGTGGTLPEAAGAFTDIPMPTPEDWEMGCGCTFPPRPREASFELARLLRAVDTSSCPPWRERLPTAVFRGRATGAGTTPATNQRLALAALSAAWARRPPQASPPAPHQPLLGTQPLLDAGITGWDTRDRKVDRNSPVSFLRPRELQRRFGIRLVPRLTQAQQARYKYVLYVEGHSAAMRYGALMASGSLILRVAETVATPHMWYTPLLRGFPWWRPAGQGAQGQHAASIQDADHLLVAPDLSDLAAAIMWAREHDALAAAIAANARRKAQRLFSPATQARYLALAIRAVGEAQEAPPSPPSPPLPVTQQQQQQQALAAWYSGANAEYAAVALPPYAEATVAAASAPSSAPASAWSTGEGKRQRTH